MPHTDLSGQKKGGEGIDREREREREREIEKGEILLLINCFLRQFEIRLTLQTKKVFNRRPLSYFVLKIESRFHAQSHIT